MAQVFILKCHKIKTFNLICKAPESEELEFLLKRKSNYSDEVHFFTNENKCFLEQLKKVRHIFGFLRLGDAISSIDANGANFGTPVAAV